MALTPVDHGRVTELAHLVHLLPLLGEEIEGRRRKIIARALSLVEKQELGPQEAQFLWMEMHALEGLWKSLETKVRLGAAVGARSMPKDLTPGPSKG